MTKKQPLPRETTRKLVTLAKMAELLNEVYAAELEKPVHYMAPYDWWKRTKSETISEPLPNPVDYVDRSPVFRTGDVIRWFARYNRW